MAKSLYSKRKQKIGALNMNPEYLGFACMAVIAAIGGAFCNKKVRYTAVGAVEGILDFVLDNLPRIITLGYILTAIGSVGYCAISMDNSAKFISGIDRYHPNVYKYVMKPAIASLNNEQLVELRNCGKNTGKVLVFIKENYPKIFEKFCILFNANSHYTGKASRLSNVVFEEVGNETIRRMYHER